MTGRLRRAAGLVRSLAIYWRPGRQKALRRLYAPFVLPGELVFDIGAHLGDRTAAFAGLGARVVALEPNPHLLPWLTRLAGRREGVEVVPEAVGAEEGWAELAVSDATPTLSTLSDAWRQRIPRENPTFRGVRWERTVKVPVTTLDRLIHRYGEPSFCKIDVEGHEASVLEGLSRPLEAVSLEFVAGGMEVATRCVRRLAGLGAYDFNAIPGEGREFVHTRWMDADAMVGWLEGGAGGASSGDVYARRRDQ
ncbi:MAG: FkbM family methyltransferase [Longimicrobiales bacterium]|nr:FkbM family methyltransferase [Longimicrobiales bacterium]